MDAEKDAKKNSYLRVAFSVVMLLGGALAVVTTQDTKTRFSILLQSLGAAFIIAGVVSLFSEFVLERWKKDPVSRIPELLGAFQERGLKMICFPRKGFWRYHSWFLVTDPQDLFFAGRSVLHRIQEDFRVRRLPSVEEALIRKLEEGSKIKVLFCNPNWGLLPQLAVAEAQPESGLFGDLATSLGIIHRLWEQLKSQKFPGEIDIRLYEEIVQYAYQRTENLQSHQREMLIGFYFAQRLGCRSPLFEADDKSIQSEFEDHFVSVFARATKLLEYPSFGQGKHFDQKLFLQCKSLLIDKIGADEVQARIDHPNES